MPERAAVSISSVKAAPSVSIVMPLYNKEAYVGHAIRSVLGQIFCDFEMIVVNDGSTDSSLKAASSIKDSRIKILDCPNRGVALARNRGVEASVANLIAFIDADDVWFERHLETLVEAAKRFPAAGMFANRYTKSLSSGGSQHNVNYSLCTNYPCASLNRGTQVWTSAVMLRRDVLSATGGFPIGESHGEDMAVWMRASLIAPVVFSDYVGAYYRQTGDGLASKLIRGSDGPDAFMKALDEMLDAADGSQELKNCLVAHKANMALAHAVTAFGYGRKDVAAEFVGKAKGFGYSGLKVFVLRVMSHLPNRLCALLVQLYTLIRKAS